MLRLFPSHSRVVPMTPVELSENRGKPGGHLDKPILYESHGNMFLKPVEESDQLQRVSLSD